jgi:hypothetical protein
LFDKVKNIVQGKWSAATTATVCIYVIRCNNTKKITIEHQVFIVMVFTLSLGQSVQLIKLSKLFFVLEAEQRAGAAHERMKRLNAMEWSEAEWNGVIESNERKHSCCRAC